MILNPEQVRKFLGCSEARACALSSVLNKSFSAYGIDTPLRVSHAISQMAHESNNFNTYTENLNYSAQALANTWPTRFAVNPKAETKTPNAKAKAIARKPQEIAEAVYSNRMGNNLPTDGWDLRGSGAIQNTGKDNIGAYAKYKGFSNVYDVARLMRESDEYAIDSACWYLTQRVKSLDEMDRDDIIALTRLINGGIIGLDHRKKSLAKAKSIFM